MTQANEAHGLAAIALSGSDSAWFLGAQLTNNLDRLGRDSHFLAAWCDARGRTVGLFYVAEAKTGFWLITSRALIDGLIRRLRMYVLRADVVITDCRDAHRVFGVLADDTLPEPGRVRSAAGVTYLGLGGAADDPPCALAITDEAAEIPDAALATESATWQLARIDAGVAQLTAATQAEFVPQMLNLHWLHAVDFEKGCYPGQEVVARLQHRGRLTRRTFRYAWRGPQPVSGAAIADAAGTAQGRVLQAAATRAGGNDGRLLAVVKTDAADQPLFADGCALTPLALPYPTPQPARHAAV